MNLGAETLGFRTLNLPPGTAEVHWGGASAYGIAVDADATRSGLLAVCSALNRVPGPAAGTGPRSSGKLDSSISQNSPEHPEGQPDQP